MRRLCATVLIMEAIVIGLSIPVAVTVDHASRGRAATAGGVLAIAAVLLAALAVRGPLRLVLIGGSILQVLVVATGAIVTAMYFLGAIFAALWAIGIWLGRRVEQVTDTGPARNTAGGAYSPASHGVPPQARPPRHR
jgi:Protein of unknown function (DUF4233)